MSRQHWLDWYWEVKTEIEEKPDFVNHKSHMHWPQIEHWPVPNAWATVQTKTVLPAAAHASTVWMKKKKNKQVLATPLVMKVQQLWTPD